MGLPHPLSMSIPSTYVMIADAIDPHYTFDMGQYDQRHLAITISEFLGLRVDPHINNFMRERHTDKILIIDTEHFPSMIGARHNFAITDYMTYYYRLTAQFLRRRLMLTKSQRIALQQATPIRLYDLGQSVIPHQDPAALEQSEDLHA